MRGPGREGGLSRWATAVAIVSILLATALLLSHLFLSTIACAFDTSYCANSSAKNGAYEGQVFVPELQSVSGIGSGREPDELYADGTFWVRFESRRGGLPPVAVQTDSVGRFCIAWAEERVTPFVEGPAGQQLVVKQPEDAHSALPTGTPAYEGVLRYWRPEVPEGCQHSAAGIPWHRAETLQSSWQFWSLLLLPVLCISAGLAALLRRRGPRAPTHLRNCLLALTANLVLWMVLWMGAG